jgi:hypothetical protein
MTVEAPSRAVNFKSAFCTQFKCSPAQFEKKLFRETIRPDMRTIAFVVRCCYPGFFRRDFECIQKIGVATNEREFLTVVNALPFDPRFNGGFLRGFLRLRISVRRLERIAKRIF